MKNLGYITLNISLIIYFINYLPQVIYNSFKNNVNSISLLTHSLMIIINSLDLIYAIGLNIQWQYILSSVILMIFLLIQQFQILNSIKNIYILIHTCIILLYIFLIFIFIYFIYIFNNYILFLFYLISGIFYNIHWIPQIYKNYYKKEAKGFSIIYLFLYFINIICDINSAIFLGWPLISIIISILLLFLILIQMIQYIYYNYYL